MAENEQYDKVPSISTTPITLLSFSFSLGLIILKPQAYLQQSASHSLANNVFADHIAIRRPHDSIPSAYRNSAHNLLDLSDFCHNLVYRHVHLEQRAASAT